MLCLPDTLHRFGWRKVWSALVYGGNCRICRALRGDKLICTYHKRKDLEARRRQSPALTSLSSFRSICQRWIVLVPSSILKTAQQILRNARGPSMSTYREQRRTRVGLAKAESERKVEGATANMTDTIRNDEMAARCSKDSGHVVKRDPDS